jgi:hypothetical protein
MNDQHVTAIAAIVQDILLILNALLIAWYLLETRKIRMAAQRQVSASLEQAESASRPAIVVRNSGSTLSSPMLENIGNGPAIEVKWSLPNSSFCGVISHMRPNAHEILPMKVLSPSTKRAVRSRRTPPVSNAVTAVLRVGNILQAMLTTRREVAIARLFRLEFDRSPARPEL